MSSFLVSICADRLTLTRNAGLLLIPGYLLTASFLSSHNCSDQCLQMIRVIIQRKSVIVSRY